MKMAHGSVCLPTSSGRKDDMAVILPELSRTASLLKQCLGAISANIRFSSETSQFLLPQAAAFHGQACSPLPSG